MTRVMDISAEPRKPTTKPRSGAGSAQLPFIGRRAERAALLAELEAGERLVSITGPSGIGKSRLAQVLAEELAAGRSNVQRIITCSLVGAEARLDAETAIYRALGLTKEHAPQIARAVGSARTFFVLDGVDAMVDAVRPILVELLNRLDNLQILMTSVVPLGLPEEVQFELGRLPPDDAATLYLERAKRLQPERPELADRSAVDGLIHRLDGIPLAIELAAGRIDVLPPQAMLTELRRRFEVLVTPQPGRHGSLSSAIAITWDLLSLEERRALSRTSVFVGGFSLEAAEAVLGMGRGEALTLLEGLRNKALLQLEESDDLRFSPYESVREFAKLQIRGTPEAATSVADHLGFFLREGEVHAAGLRGSDAGRSLRWLVQEHENLLAAHRRALSSDPVASARVGLALASILEPMGPHPSQREILNSVVSAARASGDGALLLRALITRVSALNARGTVEEARLDLREGWELSEAHGNTDQKIRILIESARSHAKVGDLALATADLDRAQGLARAHGKPSAEGQALVVRALVEGHRGEYEVALHHLEDALVVLRRNGLYVQTAGPLLGLGANLAYLHRFKAARQYLDQALAICREAGNRTLEKYYELNLAVLALTAGRLEEAESHTKRALQVEGIRGRGPFEAHVLFVLGIIAFERGDAPLAQQRLLEALEIAREGGDGRRIARTLLYVSVVGATLGHLEEARAAMEEARAHFMRVGNRFHLQSVQIIELLLEASASERSEVGASSIEERSETRSMQAASGRAIAHAIGRRLLGRALSGVPGASKRRPREGLRVGAETRWFEWEEGTRVSLTRRRILRRVLAVLLEHRQSSPGIALSADELFSAVWPDESISPDSASKRVYTAIWDLRKMGLSTALMHNGAGYLLDPSLPVVVVSPVK